MRFVFVQNIHWEEFWRFRDKHRNRKFVLQRPRKTELFTEAQLKEKGIFGVYEIIDDENK